MTAKLRDVLRSIDRDSCRSSGKGLLGRPECEIHGFLMLWTGKRWECPTRLERLEEFLGRSSEPD